MSLPYCTGATYGKRCSCNFRRQHNAAPQCFSSQDLVDLDAMVGGLPRRNGGQMFHLCSFFHVTRADECGTKRRLRASPPREGPCWVPVWGRRARTPRGQVHSNPAVDGACETRGGDSARVSCLQLAKIGPHRCAHAAPPLPQVAVMMA